MEPPLVFCSETGVKVLRGCQSVSKSKCRKEFSSCRLSIKIARLVCRLHLTYGTDITTIPVLKKQDTLTKPAGPIVSAVAADVLVPEARSSLV